MYRSALSLIVVRFDLPNSSGLCSLPTVLSVFLLHLPLVGVIVLCSSNFSLLFYSDVCSQHACKWMTLVIAQILFYSSHLGGSFTLMHPVYLTFMHFNDTFEWSDWFGSCCGGEGPCWGESRTLSVVV